MKIIKLSPRNRRSVLRRTLSFLGRGQVVVCPTDTVYGLIGVSKYKKAADKIYRIKKRPRWKLLPLFVKDVEAAKKIYHIGSRQEAFLKKKWPGSLTAVLDKKRPALRVPKNRFLLELIENTGPLFETSANLSGQPASTMIKEVLKQFEGRRHRPDLIINAGNLKPAKPSQVVDLTVWPPKVLRR